MFRYFTLPLSVIFLAACQNYTPSPSAQMPGGPASPTATPAATQYVNTAAPLPAEDVLLSEADNGKNILVKGAKNVIISLPGNATTGYAWTLGGVNGNAVELAGEIVYTAARNQPGAVGSGGIATARFRVARAGESRVTLNYARPWETNNPARTFIVTLIVEKAPG